MILPTRYASSLFKTPVTLALIITALLSSLFSTSSTAAAPPLVAYIGTFSSPLHDVLPTQVDLPPGNGRGIHIFTVDRTTGAMTPAGIFESGTSPSCLALDAAQSHLYSTNETDRAGDKKEGTVSAFAIDRADGKLKLLNTVRSGGAGPTYISIHPNGKFLFVANYMGGTVAVLPILPDGRVGEPTDIKTDTGKIGPPRPTNAPPGTFAFSGHDHPHVHMAQADPSGKFVLHVDLGLDKVFVSKFDAEHGKLIPNDPPAISLPPGDGPRHFAFTPSGQCVYIITEEASTIARFHFEPDTGRLIPRQTISALPPGFAGSNFCSEILVSPGGPFVYAGNRQHDTIAVFSIAQYGDLTFIEETPTGGNYPRSFAFDPTGNLLACCNQRGDNVTTFHVDKKTGHLTFTGHFTPVGNPSCVVFTDLATKR
jgi:6-phosphogluconolactonase (cycloisomerase 2 family)